jgi:hypothetical protein
VSRANTTTFFPWCRPPPPCVEPCCRIRRRDVYDSRDSLEFDETGVTVFRLVVIVLVGGGAGDYTSNKKALSLS